jgi:hypothetical protein
MLLGETFVMAARAWQTSNGLQANGLQANGLQAMDSSREDGSMGRGPEGLPPESFSGYPWLTGMPKTSSAGEMQAAEDTGLLALWRHRVIDLRRLTWPLRLAIAASILAALGSAALIILRDAPQAHLLIDLSSDQPHAPIPTAAFVVASALWLVAWSAALTGALFGHWALRLFVCAAFVYVTIDSVVLDAITLIYLAPLFVLALWMVTISILQWLWHRRARSLPRWLPVASFTVVFACYAAHYALVWWVGNQAHAGTSILTQLVSIEFEAYSFVLLPVLFLTGSDFAEWGEAVAAQGNALLRRFRSAWPLVGVTVVVAIAVLANELSRRGSFAPFDLASGLDLASLGLFGCLGILLLVGIVLLGKVRGWPRLAVPPGALVAATVLVMGLLVGPVYLTDFILSLTPTSGATVDYTVLSHAATSLSPKFSMAYPSDWRHVVSEPTNAQDILLVGFDGQDMTGDPQLFVVGIPAAGESGATPDQIAQQVATGLCTQKTCTATVDTAPDHGPWTVERTVVHDQESNGQPVERDGLVWIQTNGTTNWALYGSAQPAGAQAAAPIFTAMVDSWRPDLTAVAPASPEPPLVTFLLDHQLNAPIGFGLIPLAFGLLIGLPLLVRGRRRSGPLAVAGLFLVVLGLRDVLLFLPQIIAQFGVPTHQIVLVTLGGERMRLSTMPTLSLPVLQTLAAFFTLVIAGWFIVRRRIGGVGDVRATRVIAALLLLNVGLQVISWLDAALTATDQLANRFTVAQGVLLVLAFLWDLLTSGDQVTNTQGRLSPRFARVLIYVGYSMLSFSQVLFFTTLRGSSNVDFTSDWADIGLTLLGIPLLLTVVLMRLARNGATPSGLGGADERTLEQGVYVRSGLQSFGSSPDSSA